MNADESITLGSFAKQHLQPIAGCAGGWEPSDDPRASCRAGCGACCRQLVSISLAEALHLAEVVDRLPEGRREDVLGRFAAAEDRLRSAVLWERLLNLNDPTMTGEDHYNLARDYFRLAMACPFLESESCSIYEERPALCREYRVSSPRERCDDPFTNEVEVIASPVRVGDALGGLSAQMLKTGTQVIPLAMALAWVRVHPESRTQAWDRAELEARFELHWDIKLGQG